MQKFILLVVATELLGVYAFAPMASQLSIQRRAASARMALTQVSDLPPVVVPESEMEYRKRMSGDATAIANYEAAKEAAEAEALAKAEEERLGGLTPQQRKAEDAKLAKAEAMAEVVVKREAAAAERAAKVAAAAEARAAAAEEKKAAAAAAVEARKLAAEATKAAAAAAAAERKAALAAKKPAAKGAAKPVSAAPQPAAGGFSFNFGGKKQETAKAAPPAKKAVAKKAVEVVEIEDGESPSQVFERAMAPLYGISSNPRSVELKEKYASAATPAAKPTSKPASKVAKVGTRGSAKKAVEVVEIEDGESPSQVFERVMAPLYGISSNPRSVELKEKYSKK